MTMQFMGGGGQDSAEVTGMVAHEAYDVAVEKGMLPDGSPCDVLITRTVITGSDREDIETRSKTLRDDLKNFVQREDRDGTRLYPTAVYTDSARVNVGGKIRIDGRDVEGTLKEIRETLSAQGVMSEEDIDAAIEFARQQIPGLGGVPEAQPEFEMASFDDVLDLGLWEIARPTWTVSPKEG